MALLRYIYGLPYNQVMNETLHLLQHHALVCVAAIKYQVYGLQEEACGAMMAIFNSPARRLQDFFAALRIVFDPLMETSEARACMVTACVAELRALKRSAEFRSLWQEFPDMGLEILDHPDLDNGLQEAKVGSGNENSGLRKGLFRWLTHSTHTSVSGRNQCFGLLRSHQWLGKMYESSTWTSSYAWQRQERYTL